MKRAFALLCLLLAGIALPAQQPGVPRDIVANQITLPLSSPPQMVSSGSAHVVGNPGNGIYYYWVVANFPIGNSSPAGPFVAINAPAVLSSSDAIQVSWSPVPGATSYDVMRTSTPQIPAGTCNCAIAVATTTVSATDQGNALQSYTVQSFDASEASAILQVVGTAAGADKLTVNFGKTTALSIDSSAGLSAASIEQIRYADWYGASPTNSAAQNTIALQAWLDSGADRLYLPDGVYTTNELTLPSNVEIFGPGTLKQASAGHEVFYCTSCSNVWIHEVTLQGAGGNGISPAPTNDDCGIRIANSAGSPAVSGIHIDHVTFSGWLLYAAYIQNATDVWFAHNYIHDSGPVVRLEGVTDAHITDNVASDTAIDAAVFKSAISLPGTTGGYSTDQHVLISDNTIVNYSNTQAVLIHSCTDCTIEGNHLIAVNQGVGVAPATTADSIVRVTIRGNTYESTTVGGGSTGNQCILAGGQPSGYASQLIIEGNSCSGANSMDENAGEGAIGLSYTDGALVEGNTIVGSYVSGIYLNNVNTNLHVEGNVIKDGKTADCGAHPSYCTLNEAVYLPSSQGSGSTGWIANNTVSGYEDGFRFDTAAPGLQLGENVVTSITGVALVSPSNVTVASTFLGTVNAQYQQDAYPSVVLDAINREICLGPGSIACDVTVQRGAGGTLQTNAQIAAPSVVLGGIRVVASSPAPSDGNCLVYSPSASQFQPGSCGAAYSAQTFGNGNAQSAFPSGVTANQLSLYALEIPTALQASKISYWVDAGDATTTDAYSLGIYNSSGTLVAHVAPIDWQYSGTARTDSLVEGTVTLPAGMYFVGLTGDAATATLYSVCGAQKSFVDFASSSYATTTSGALPASITAPTLAPAQGCAPYIFLGK